MKAEPMKVNTQDRLATWEEIRGATSYSPDRLLDLCQAGDTYCEVGSDLGGIIRYPAEEFEFFAYLSELDETPAN